MRRFAVAALAALPFMAAITALDLVAPFPADINVPLPAALAFYPAMGFFAQLALHVIPFAVLLVALTTVAAKLSLSARVWTAILLASLIEAVFQIGGADLEGRVLTVQAAVLAVHVFAFGCVELFLYKRYDFAAMYAFRLTYYAWWHVIWGVLRLQG